MAKRQAVRIGNAHSLQKAQRMGQLPVAPLTAHCSSFIRSSFIRSSFIVHSFIVHSFIAHG